MNIIVKIKMEKDKKLKQKRLRLKPSVSDAIKDSPESFEKPTSQRFYEKLKQNTPALQSVLCVAMKSKMRYLKAVYVTAAAWKNKTGSGLLANGDESSVSAHVNKTLTYWELSSDNAKM
ncbi:uncharacterized protein LOC120781635 [Bactrocera tryoni]|uniref:uncharacterized protein LOC120781635 n=1 Tax=Bactrocera tryoni TaxID=59916 RepID=UPI001A96EC8E|nr:uncharacterized protein LOC120781635 [Bactrocera tryoni]